LERVSLMKSLLKPKMILPLVVLSLFTMTCARGGPARHALPTAPPRVQETSSPLPVGDIGVNGSLEDVNGVRVLRVWGSRQEMGYAYGYLLADELLDMYERGLFGGILSRLPPEWTYERLIGFMEQHVLWLDGDREEMEAVAQGMAAALGGPPRIAHERIKAGSAVADAQMLALMNAIEDLTDVSPHCCSFAAWGQATSDGRMRVAGSLQGGWKVRHEHPLLVVRKPDDGLATVCTGCVGMMSCSRGMNEAGVVVMPQGAETPWIEVDGPCYVRTHPRAILEHQPAGPDLVSRIVDVFEKHPGCGSSVFLFAQGSPTWDDPRPEQMAVAIEQSYTGVTPRLATHNPQHDTPLGEVLVVVNFWLQREAPASQPCSDCPRRYKAMVAACQQGPIASIADMQKILIACDPTNIALESVYVEPDAGLIHVAFRPGPDAPASPYLTPVTFRLEDLLAPIPD